MLVLEGGTCGLRPALAAALGPADELHLASALPEQPLPWDVALVHWDSFPTGAQAEILRSLDALRRHGRLLAYVGRPSREATAHLLGDVGVHNLFSGELSLDPEALGATLAKMGSIDEDIFGIDRYFSQACGRATLSLGSSVHKAELLGAAGAFARPFARLERLVEQFTTTVDELVTNALFNGPVDVGGRRLYADRPRTEVVTLGAGERVDVELRCDGRRLGVSVSDPFGTLTVEALTQRVGQPIGVPTGRRSSAGVGLYSVHSMVSHLAVNLVPGRRTELVAMMDVRGGSYRDFVRRGSAFNLFVRLAP